MLRVSGCPAGGDQTPTHPKRYLITSAIFRTVGGLVDRATKGSAPWARWPVAGTPRSRPAGFQAYTARHQWRLGCEETRPMARWERRRIGRAWLMVAEAISHEQSPRRRFPPKCPTSRLSAKTGDGAGRPPRRKERPEGRRVCTKPWQKGPWAPMMCQALGPSRSRSAKDSTVDCAGEFVGT